MSLFFSDGVFGIHPFYVSFYIETVLDTTSLQTTAWFVPMANGGLILATVGALTVHHLSGTMLMIRSTTVYIISVLLIALMPSNPSYWAWIPPAMICATVAIGITYSVSNIFITTSLPNHQRGLAGVLINYLVFPGISFCVRFAHFAVSSTAHLDARRSYQVAFWFAVGCAGVALLVIVMGIRIDKAKSCLALEEKAKLEAELIIGRTAGVG